MKKYDLVKNKIEEIFRELKIRYEKLDLDDDDLNYEIRFNTFGRFKALDSIEAILYIHRLDFSLNFIVFNIYNLRDENGKIDTLDLYEIVNYANSELRYGSFLIEDNKHIFYKSSINCNSDYSGLNSELLQIQISVFIDGLKRLFDFIRRKETGNE